MSVDAKITYKRLPLTKVGHLHRLFAGAVYSSFTYFDADIQARTIRQHRPHRLLMAALNPRRIIITAWNERELVGYAIGSVPRNRAGQLYWLYVEPNSRGSNTGLALLSRVLRDGRRRGATSITLATHDHRRYYERQGFRYLQTNKVDGVPMDIMKFELS